ncbi:MAG: hypothetical protein H7338_01075 [Candidatus Sericytochromatia bacterium]|nr:hypothetical protein [Candidatus Sericytochromatia bacterium]
MSASPPAGENAEAWRQRMSNDPTAIVALADHLLRTCGLSIRMGNAVDPAAFYELQSGLRQVPPGSPADAPLLRAQQLLDGGAMALSGIISGNRIAPADIDPMLGEIGAAMDRGDESLARNMAPQVLASLIQTEIIPELVNQPDSGVFSCWFEAAMRIRQARWG